MVSSSVCSVLSISFQMCIRDRDKGAAGEADADLKATVLEAVKRVDEKMDKLRVADAITEIFGIFRRSNKYIDETMPWTLAKDCLLYTSRCV